MRAKNLIKITSCVMIAAFIALDIVWAYPDAQRIKAGESHLQSASAFWSTDNIYYEHRLVLISSLMEVLASKGNDIREFCRNEIIIPSRDENTRIEIAFEERQEIFEGYKWLIPVTMVFNANAGGEDQVIQRYNAIIEKDSENGIDIELEPITIDKVPALCDYREERTCDWIPAVDESDLETVHKCPSCQTWDHKLVGKIVIKGRRGPIECSMVKCPHCGTTWLRKRPSDREMAKLYSSPDYFNKESPLAGFKYNSDRREIAKKRMDELEAIAKKKGKILEVGCGYGYVLEEAIKRGWQAEGLDISGAAISSVRAKGILIHDKDVTAADLTPGSYDVILSYSSLEHLHDPLLALQAMRRSLSDDGIMVVRIPFINDDEVPGTSLLEHLYHFTQPGFERMADNAGFEITQKYLSGESVKASGVTKSVTYTLRKKHAVSQAGPQFNGDAGKGTAENNSEAEKTAAPVTGGTPWWEQKKRGGILCPLYAGKRDNDQGIGDLKWLEGFIDLLSKQNADMAMLLPTTQTNKSDPCPYAGISLFANNAIFYLPLDELIGHSKLLQYVESFVASGTETVLSVLEGQNTTTEQYLASIIYHFRHTGTDGIDRDDLKAEIERQLRQKISAMKTAKRIDYPLVYALKEHCLRSAFDEIYGAISVTPPQGFQNYIKDNSDWLQDYSVYHSLLNHYNGKPWWQWDKAHKERDAQALADYKGSHKKEILFYQYLQWQYSVRWQRVRDHARLRGKYLIGDMPMYPSANSSDVWAHQDYFDFTKNAGAPPEPGIAPDGQNWQSNPFRWWDHKKEVFEFWVRRVQYMSQYYDAVRIDHVLGLFSEWLIDIGKYPKDGSFYPNDGNTAAEQGKEIIEALARTAAASNTLLIGEDIGDRPKVIRDMLDKLAENLPNFFLYNPVGWREAKMARKKHVMVVEATHDTPPTFRQRWPLLESSYTDRPQASGYLKAHGIDMADNAEAIESQVIEAMKNEDFSCFTLQTVMGDETPDNVPGTWGLYNWSRRSDDIEDLLTKDNLHFFDNDQPAVLKRADGPSYRSKRISSSYNERIDALTDSMRTILSEEKRPILSLDLDDTLTPFGAHLDQRTTGILVNYLKKGGVLALNTLATKEFVYRRVIEHIMQELIRQDKLYLLENIFLIMAETDRMYDSKEILRYDTAINAYRRIFRTAHGTKGTALAWLMKCISPERASLLAYYGDNYNMFLNDATAIGMPQVHNVVNVGQDLDPQTVWLIAKACLEHGFYPMVEEAQHIFNTGHGGTEATINDILKLTEMMPERPDVERAVSRQEPSQADAVWTFENKDSLTAGPEQTVKVLVGTPGHGAPGFLWAGVKNAGGDWDKKKAFLIPLRLAPNGQHEAELPIECNVFTFFWTGGDDARSSWVPGHWEGRDYEIRREPKDDGTSMDFLRNITDEEALAGNLIAGIESYLHSGKRLVIAVNSSLQGMDKAAGSGKLRAVLRQLDKWKERMKEEHPGMANLLDNVIGIEYSTSEDLAEKLKDPGIVGNVPIDTANKKDNFIFTFSPASGPGRDTSGIGQAVRPVIIKEEGTFGRLYYYPLIEIITISISKELMKCSSEKIKETFARLGTALDDINISDLTDSPNAYLIFTILPKAGGIDPAEQSKRYSRILEFIRSA